ncbi:MAG TPA: amino acid adenylation domain-containing protein [Candidatus Kapabacteria bacterium]|nr:amino acid adenylation domain-containing protein [Candidatus Kapabacteria bacterium]
MTEKNMMIDYSVAAQQCIEENKYWGNKLSGELVNSHFPYDTKGNSPAPHPCKVPLEFTAADASGILKLANNSDYRLHMILTAAVAMLLERYSGHDDIIIGSPVYKQETEANFVNMVLALRNYVLPGLTFKELLLQVKDTILEAVKNQNFPVQALLYKLGIPNPGENETFPLFDTAVLLENIHDLNYLRHINLNMIFSLNKAGKTLTGVIYYNGSLFAKKSIERLAGHFTRLLAQVPAMIDAPLDNFEILSEEEKIQLLVEFNDTEMPYPAEKTLWECFEENAARTPDHIALSGHSVADRRFTYRLSYRELNERADRLAYILWERGARRFMITAIFAEKTVEMITGILAILKSGGVYLPIDPEYPESRVNYMLENCNASFILGGNTILKERSFPGLTGLLVKNIPPVITAPRPPIHNLDWLPFPDRSLIDYQKYSKNISLAMVKHSISLQGTRGCPYNCAYCAKLWPKKHVVRSAEHIFAEVLQYYQIGIRRFSFIDDIFNLDIENSRWFFRMVIANGLNIQIFFPAGLRGDIMTPDYIDLMVQAGTVNISVALETASPRLQKLIGKNLNISKLRENLEYICAKHPHVILDLFTMHGLPTETEAEAMMTLEFIKSLKWLHFPLINILKIYPGTDMEKLALDSGISREAILEAENLPWHEFSETLPFSKNFTMKYQADFLDSYFLLKERLLQVLPNQMKSLTRDEIVQKYKSYLPVEIHNFDDLLRVIDITEEQLHIGQTIPEDYFKIDSLNEKIRSIFPYTQPGPGALKILLLDLSQSFSADNRLLDEMLEPPLGLMYLLTTLNREYGPKIAGKIAKSGIDFDNYAQLKKLLSDFNPDLIGIRTLTFYKDFFHKTISLIRQWGIQAPVITGGPYATNGYMSLLQDSNIDLVVLAEGEMTFLELVSLMLENNKQLPGDEVLKKLPGIVFVPGKRDCETKTHGFASQVINLDYITTRTAPFPSLPPLPAAAQKAQKATGNSHDPAYIIFTSGSTGKPKGVLIENKNAVNLVTALNERVYRQYPGCLKVGLLAPFVFDASIKQIFAALLLGHHLCLVPEETRLDGVGLLAYYKREVIDICDGTPAYIHLLSESMDNTERENWGQSSVKHFLIGGEQLAVPVVARFFKQCGSFAPKITNVYGPTECTVDAAAFEITVNNIDRHEIFPIGTPLANVKVYILGKSMVLLPLGVAGELCIGGAGVGRGYINQPELTRVAFEKAPLDTPKLLIIQHSQFTNDRLYKTGDLARWLDDGNIEFLGRIDNQVKIRGYRIELEEIENLVLHYPGIKDAVVTTITKSMDNANDDTGNAYICAYFTVGLGQDGENNEIDQNDLKKYLARQLPAYMLPWKYVALEKIPLTPNGKVDKKALPVPEEAGEKQRDTYIAPGTKTQEKLAAIWSEILGVEQSRIGIDTDFFELGGHSLKAVILLSRIYKEFGVKISLVDIFSAPVIRKISASIDHSVKEIFIVIEPAEEREYYELSPAQKRMYILQTMSTTGMGTSYNKPYVLILRGSISLENLAQAFRQLINRHAIFRTSFVVINGKPVQRIHKHVDFDIAYTDISTTDKGMRDHTIKHLIDTFIRPFELAGAPLMRAGLIKIDDHEHLLMIDIHHITSDGMAMGILVKEFMMILDGKPLPLLRLQYKDYSYWQNSDVNLEILAKQKKYWLEILSGEIPVLNLQPDFPRPTLQSFLGNRTGFEFSSDETISLNKIVRETKGTIYTLMLSIFYVCLDKVSGQEDIIIGTPVMGRRHADLEHLIGMFVNTLAMRNYPAGHKSFKEFAVEVKNRALEAFDNQDYQFESLLDDLELVRDISRNPLFDVLFALQKFDIPRLEIKALTIESYDYENKTSKFDLNWMGSEIGDRLVFSIEYCTKLFKPETVERFIAYFKRITTAIIGNPTATIKEIEIISDEEKTRVLYQFNNTVAEYPREKTIHQLFEEQVEKVPDHIVLSGKFVRQFGQVGQVGHVSLSYFELNEHSACLASLLIEKGILADNIVAIKMERSIEMVIAILATLKTGCAYMPIDPGYPQERIDYMLKDSKATLTINYGFLKEAPQAPLMHSAFDISRTQHSDLIYVIYTSGSTGKPKGVMIEHRSVVRLVINNDFIEFSDKLRVLQTGAPVFDAVTFEMWGPLLNGGQLYLEENEIILEPAKLGKILLKYHINTLWLTSSLFNQLVHENNSIFSTLEWLVVGGDILSPNYIAAVRNKNKNLNIVNGYGPTENTTFSVCHRIDRDYENNIPIGKPIRNSTAYIMDKYNHLQPIGIAGELYVGGDGLARGYLNNPELTAEKFIYFPNLLTSKLCNFPLYRTGDLARRLPGGLIEFLGRIDNQVKIRGFRVELGEIENRLLNLPGVKDAVVTMQEEGRGDKYMCAYIVSDRKYSILELRESLSKELPAYMIPSYFVPLEKIPLTINGKVDRKMLPKPGLNINENYTAPGNEIETKLVEIWSEILGRGALHASIGIDDNFFELGGHSLNATIMIYKIHKHLEVKVQLIEIFRTPTIRDIARLILGLKKETFHVIEPVEKKGYYPLSSAQKRLYFLQQLDLNSTSYNMPIFLSLGQGINKDKLESTLKQLISRHESLRTSIVRVNEGVVQRIHPVDSIRFSLDYYDASETGSEEIIKNYVRPFNLSRAPLIRSMLIMLPGGYYTLIVDVHHIISDGTSLTILIEDFLKSYVNGVSLKPLPIQYKDFAHWQNQLFENGRIKDQEEYWLQLYSGEIPRLNLPVDYKRPGVFTFEGDRYMFKLEREDAVKFKALGIQHGGTLYMNIMSALNTLFYKYTGQADIIIGSGIAGRQHADIQDVVGMFVNTLAMRNYPVGEKSYENFLQEVITNSVKGFENQDVQFEELVDKLDPERDPSRNPLFDVLMVVQNFREVDTTISLKQLLPAPGNSPAVEYKNLTSKFDLTFFVQEQGDDVSINIEYYTGIFSLNTIQRLGSHFKYIIQTVIKEPGIPLREIAIISEEEKQRLLFEFNDTTRDYPRDKSIPGLFEEQVERTPDRIAVFGRGGTRTDKDNGMIITYRQLNEQSNRLANYLHHGKPVTLDQPVGIMMDRSYEMIAAVLGILKAGGAYVPISPSYPLERIKKMTADTGIKMLLSQKRYIKTLNRLQWECGVNLETFLCIDSQDIYSEEEVEENQLMSRKLWEYVGDTAVDEVTGGGWNSSYTGEPISQEEMDEYGDNILKKLEPLLHKEMRVLEIGVASGISMYRIAPRVGLYYGTDLSEVIIEKNKRRITEEGHKNIKLMRAPAHEIDQMDEKNFDLIIINSVIQCFHGHNYLRNVIRKAIDLLGSRGYLFIGDIMDQDLKEDLIADLVKFRYAHRGHKYKTKTDWSEELFISRSFLEDVAWDYPQIYDIEFSGKIHTIENELTQFRYDALMKIDRSGKERRKLTASHRPKTALDLRILEKFSIDKLRLSQDGNNLAYIIYTSGSTGIPKGVMVEHRSVGRLVKNTNFIDFKADDRILQTGALEFDASTLEIWGALLNGLALVLEIKENLLEAKILKEIITKHKITIMWMTSSFFNRVLDENVEVFAGLRYLLAGGEALSSSHINRLRSRFPGLYVINGYGPTENTTFSTTFLIDREYPGNIPIGKPIANSTAYVLNRDGGLLPPGVPGELYVGGDGLSRGYLNSPELTGEKFDHSKSFSGGIGGRLYKKAPLLYCTGDLARWLTEGVIEFLGRIDNQVKIRGYRIEMQEIENRLLKAEGVKEAVVIDMADASGSKYLCAYVVIEEEFQITGLRDLLSKNLPDYMIPSYFVPMKIIPLTSNGKIDRKALPGPEAAVIDGNAHGLYIAPRDDVENKLVEIFHDVLSQPQHAIGIDNNFFELGGHSLKATELVSKIHKNLNVKIPLVEVFKTPTIRELTAYIKVKTQEMHISIQPAEAREYYVLSSAQKRIYFLQQFDLTGIGYNMPLILSLGRSIEKDKLEFALRRIIDRYESLRTYFERVNEEVVQRIHKAGSIEFSIDYYETDKTGLGKIIKDYIRPFDLNRAPLIRSALIRLTDDNYIWVVDVHHIVSDGTSNTILTEDFLAVYSGKELRPLSIQYKDFALWQQRRFEKGEINVQLAYWLDLFAGEIPRLNLPADNERPPVFTFEGDSYRLVLAGAETKKFKQLGVQGGGTLYMNMLAALNVLFYKYTGQSDIIIGSGIAGRRHADLHDVVGMFINTLVMRNYPEGEKTYESFLKEVITSSLKAFDNQDIQFEDLVDNLNLERDASRNPVFDIMMMVQNFRRVGKGGNSRSEYADKSAIDMLPIVNENLAAGEYKISTSKFDMTFFVHEQGDDVIIINIEYYSAVFKPGTIQRLASHLINVIKSAATDSFIKLKEIEIISDDEKKKIIYEFNDTVRSYPGDKTLHQLFAEQSSRTPDHIALIGTKGEAKKQRCEEEKASCVSISLQHQITYRQLNEQTDCLAGFLIKKGVQTDTIVGIMMERSLEMIIGIMGILKSGGAYLPIDPEYPQERIKFMLSDSAASILLTDDEKRKTANCQLSIRQAIFYHSSFIGHHSNQLAYIIYTSGSTGKPKGVAVKHQSLLNFIKGITDFIPITVKDRVLSLTTISFDIFGLEIFVPLANGSSVVMGSREEQINPEATGLIIEQEKISILQLTPSRLQMIISTPRSAGSLKILKFLLVGGEVFPALLLEKVGPLVMGKIFNMYGPTETTIWSAVKELCAAGETLNIGKPIANTVIYILDNSHLLVPIGIPGELYIGGDGLARGYLNQPELCAEKFKKYRSYRTNKTHIFYRTGDLARWLPNGNLEFLGREDGQVKIRGYRIELGEIEKRLLEYTPIKEAVVLLKESESGDKHIIAYMAVETGYSENKLRGFLADVLPEYMIPSFFICLEKVPLTPNGKIDRRALPDPWSKIEKIGKIAPKDELEFMLTSIWAEVLHIPIEKIGMESNFFHLGGHSLMAMYLISNIHKMLNIKIQLAQVFKKPTLGGILEIIRREVHVDYSGIEAVEEREYYDLSSAQKRLYFLQQIAPESISYNMPIVYPLGREVSKEKLKHALNELIYRHDSLRTSFIRVDDVLVQRVQRVQGLPGLHRENYEIDVNIEFYETSTNTGDEEKEISGWIKAFIRPFDLTAAPLLRSALIQTQNGDHIWVVDTHHVVSDGTSTMILAQDFLDLYNGKLLPSLTFQYKDYSHWQNRLFTGSEILEQQDFWLSMFSADIPRLEMPLDYKRPDVFTFAGDRFLFKLDSPDAANFRTLGIQENSTLYMNILTALSVLLYKYTGQEDIVIGSAIAGRPHADLQYIIGMFVNTLAMRNYPTGDKIYSAFLNEVAANSIKAFENQDVQFEELLERLNPERDTSRNPLFDISMVVQNFHRPGDHASIFQQPQIENTCPTFNYRNTSAKFDMTFFVIEQGEDVLIDIEYYTGIFKCETIQRLLSHFQNVIKAVITDPAIKLRDIEIISAAEKESLLNVLNNTDVAYPVEKTAALLIAEQVEQVPDHIALIGPCAGENPYSSIHISYRELAESANQVANYLLLGKNIRAEEPVGLLMDKSIQTIIAMVGVLKSGGVYVPIDTAFPEQRIKTIIDDGYIHILLSEKKFLKTLNRLQWECSCLNTYLCLDTRDVDNESEEESLLMDRKLWEYVGESAVDDITGGGWKSSYTGLAIPTEEMAEYGQNVLEKINPFLHQNTRVLEIGCATGLTMYRVAPKVGFYYGTDLSSVIIERNRERVEKEGHANIKLKCLPAYEIHNIQDNNFDIIILNSVIQHFSGHNYLRSVIEKAIRLLAPQGIIFIGDIMDLDMKDALIKDLSKFKKANQDKDYRTKTDWSEELFISRDFFKDIEADIPLIQAVSFSDKIRTIENELTKFRYDTIITINKNVPFQNKGRQKYKYRDDVKVLEEYPCLQPGVRIEPHNLLYIIYTSGTTGKPKGVLIEHRNIVRLLVNNRNLFDFNRSDVWMMFHSYNFDFSVWEMYGALVFGGKLIIIPRVIARDTSAFLELIIRQSVTVLNQTPTAFYRLEEEEADRPVKQLKLRYLIFGGEALVPSKLKNWQQRYSSLKIINMYGITETTVHVTYKEINTIEIENNSRSIGEPIPTLSAMVLDKHFHLLPRGVPGELYVGGAGVTRGYLNRPELSAEKFRPLIKQVAQMALTKNKINKNFAGVPLVIYKTGDLVKVLENDELEYLGRIDSQVKIRGFRIEILEIESCLRSIDSIKDAVVIARTDENGDNHLAAYFVSSKTFDTSELRDALSRSLPDYMIPAFLMQLAAIPLTPNGKLDKKALPLSETGLAYGNISKYAAPRDKIEEKLVSIWNEVLGRSGGIGIDDNFFELGGHSLKATTVVSKIHKVFNVKVPLVEIFKKPFIRELATYIKGIEKEHHIAIETAEEKEYYPLSSAQKRLYILDKMDLDSTTYNMPGIIPLTQAFEGKKIEETFKKLIKRHESLRTSFNIVNGIPVQFVHNEVVFSLDLHDNNIKDFLKKFVRPFDLTKAPLIRAALLKDKDRHYILIVDMHHIISDGISYEVLVNDFQLLYSGGHLPPLRVQYKDYSEWQNSTAQQDEIRRQKNYWLEEFSGPLPLLNLPLDYPRKETRSFAGQTIEFILGKEETTALKELALKEGFTLFFLCVCLFNIFLYKITGQEDIIIGVTAAGRKHIDLENVIGMFVNTIALRNFPAGEKKFSEFAHEVKKRTFNAFTNEDYQFEDVVNLLGIKKIVNRNPLFDVAFSFLQKMVKTKQYPKDTQDKPRTSPTLLPEENYRYNSSSSRFDLSLFAINAEDEILFSFEYCSELFRKEKIEKFIKYFLEIITQVLKNINIKLCDINISHELFSAPKPFEKEINAYDEF